MWSIKPKNVAGGTFHFFHCGFLWLACVASVSIEYVRRSFPLSGCAKVGLAPNIALNVLRAPFTNTNTDKSKRKRLLRGLLMTCSCLRWKEEQIAYWTVIRQKDWSRVVVRGCGWRYANPTQALRQRPPTFFTLFAALCNFDKTRLDYTTLHYTRLHYTRQDKTLSARQDWTRQDRTGQDRTCIQPWNSIRIRSKKYCRPFIFFFRMIK